MIISGKQIQNITKLYGDQAQIAKSGKKQGNSPLQQKDEVILSSQAQGFSHLLQQAKNMSGVREERVKELSAKIDAGEYQVSADKIAEKMLSYFKANHLR